MTAIDLDQIASRLESLESLALISRVASTNAVARRVVHECIENDIALPKAMVIAREQYAGEGRASRTWSSPAGKGIYATTLVSREPQETTLIPLEVANFVVRFLQSTYGIRARVKWPNDILVDGRKIAGVLIEARTHESQVYLVIGIGINVLPSVDVPTTAVSIADLQRERPVDLDDATTAFIEAFDHELKIRPSRELTIDEWTRNSVHQRGDRISCNVGGRMVQGTWNGIDDDGRVVLRNGDETILIAAGDLILHEPAAGA
ncbi:MAG TPA: biotin--[acetyl-CoA-carboxylase] ligase [Thermoanaerobaculia bacterium]|nr:biotin--[acetyl-CoA-carboxylase] ligase [Thermoanaerobaculia bacterium]